MVLKVSKAQSTAELLGLANAQPLKEPEVEAAPAPAFVSDEGTMEIVSGTNMTLEELASRIIALDKQIAPLQPQIKQLAELKKKASELVGKLGADATSTVVVEGEHGKLEYSPQAKVREVTKKAALLMLLGEDTFIALANFKLTDVDKYVAESEQGKIITKSQTGARSLKILHEE